MSDLVALMAAVVFWLASRLGADGPTAALYAAIFIFVADRVLRSRTPREERQQTVVNAVAAPASVAWSASVLVPTVSTS